MKKFKCPQKKPCGTQQQENRKKNNKRIGKNIEILKKLLQK